MLCITLPSNLAVHLSTIVKPIIVRGTDRSHAFNCLFEITPFHALALAAFVVVCGARLAARLQRHQAGLWQSR
jgi:hypothetical protein